MLNDFTGADKVYIACGYTDLRKGIDGLAQILCKHREAVQNRAKIIYGGSGVSCCRLVYKITAV